MTDIFTDITPETLIFMILNFFLSLVLLGMVLSNSGKLKRLKAKYYRFMDVSGDVNLEELLGQCIDKVNEVVDKNKELENLINHIERNMVQCMQKVGIVRFNAFENVGSDLSFAIALLDNNDDGIVISSIYSRDSCSTYAKPVSAGKSRYSLSAEEIQALDMAKRSHSERLYVNK
jgi:hypothetical protein